MDIVIQLISKAYPTPGCHAELFFQFFLRAFTLLSKNEQKVNMRILPSSRLAIVRNPFAFGLVEDLL